MGTALLLRFDDNLTVERKNKVLVKNNSRPHTIINIEIISRSPV